MTGEEHTEELLWNAHKMGVHAELCEIAKNLRTKENNMSFADSVYRAYHIMELDQVEQEI